MNSSTKTIIRRAIVGGVVSTLVMAIGTFILGEISGYKAKELLASSLSGINMLCNTVILGSSTILALMLTLLGLSRNAESHLTNTHYQNVFMIAKADTILIIISVITLMLFNLPITEAQDLPPDWFTTIYYVSLAMAALIGGGFIALITMLYGTIANVILIVGLGVTDHPLVDNDYEEKTAKKRKTRE
jgi:MFS family permease